MKVNKLSSWVYGILMLMPFLMFGFYVLMYAFNRGSLPTEISSYSSFIQTFENTFGDSNNWFFNWITSSPFFNPINDFCMLLSGSMLDSTFISYYLTWGITISLVYLGYEVLLAFINIARKLVYAFVDKEF